MSGGRLADDDIGRTVPYLYTDEKAHPTSLGMRFFHCLISDSMLVFPEFSGRNTGVFREYPRKMCVVGETALLGYLTY